jgi:hypothetical protein
LKCSARPSGNVARLAVPLREEAYDDDRASFRYAVQTGASEAGDSIGRSSLLAAWNAAVYVARIEDGRMREALATTKYLDGTRARLRRCGSMTSCA